MICTSTIWTIHTMAPYDFAYCWFQIFRLYLNLCSTLSKKGNIWEMFLFSTSWNFYELFKVLTKRLNF